MLENVRVVFHPDGTVTTPGIDMGPASRRGLKVVARTPEGQTHLGKSPSEVIIVRVSACRLLHGPASSPEESTHVYATEADS